MWLVLITAWASAVAKIFESSPEFGVRLLQALVRHRNLYYRGTQKREYRSNFNRPSSSSLCLPSINKIQKRAEISLS